MSCSEDAEGAFDEIMSWLLFSFEAFELDQIGADGQVLAQTQGRFALPAVGHGAGDAQDDEHDAKVNDESAVAPLVAPRQSDQAADDTFAGDAPARAQGERGVIK